MSAFDPADAATAVFDDGAREQAGQANAAGPQGPPAKRRARGWKLGTAIGIPAIALFGVGWYFGTTLIAPGVAVAGVPLGGMTVDAASERITQAVANSAITVSADGSTATLTGTDLGASLPAAEIAADALENNPLWKVTAWFPEDSIEAAPEFDEQRTTESVTEAFPDVHVAPIDAGISFNAEAGTYQVVQGTDGKGVDPVATQRAFSKHLSEGTLTASDTAGAGTAAFTATVESIAPVLTNEIAQAKADELNALLDSAGFYVGDERTVDLEPATVASWITVTADPENAGFTVSVDETKIQPVVEGLPEAVNREPRTAEVITNADGREIETIIEGQTGRKLGSVDGIAGSFAEQLLNGNAVYTLPVEETPFEKTSISRQLDVDLSKQVMYKIENGTVIDSWSISSGQAATPTTPGSYEIGWKTPMQDMGCVDGFDYCTKDVKWAMYFNGDEAFHGVYWHSNWGTPMSHGCVGMPEWRAAELYDWAAPGTTVNIY